MNTMVQSLKELGQLKLGLMAAAAVLLIGFFIFFSMRLATPAMSPLYSNLSMEDSAKIVSELEKDGIPYELRANGTQVMIPSDQALRFRLTLAEQGLPSAGSGIGYEVFDRSEALGTSNFVLNVNMLRALEGELARTIGSMAQVESARVHLVIPKRELFTREKQEPTASVALKLRGSGELSKQEIAAIAHLVATAVPGLKTSGITIVDNQGRLLLKGGEKDSAEAMASNAQEYRIAYENRLKNTIESLLEQSVGQGKVKVQVTADIDFDRVVTNSEVYDPEKSVLRSNQSTEEKENSNEKNASDNVSVANNLPDANKSDAGTVSTRNTQRTDETNNYEVSKEVTNHVKESGTTKKLSVAVLVDGVYAPDGDGNPVYAPRKEDELKQIEALVRSAVGFDEKRGDTVKVVNMRFTSPAEQVAQESALDWLKDDMQGIIQTLVLGGVAVLAILLVVRPLINRAIETSEASEENAEADQAALTGPGMTARLTDQSGGMAGEEEEESINIDRIQGRVKSSTFRKINEMVDKHPDETIGVLRQWILKEA